MNSVITYKKLNIKDFQVTEPKVNNFGGKFAYVNYDGESKYGIQTPKMRMPFKMSIFTPENGDAPKYSISLAFDKDNKNIKMFFDKMVEFDKYIINLGVKNSQKWFKKKHKRAVVEALYSPIVRFSTDKKTGEKNDKFSPTFKLKLYKNRTTGDFVCKVFDNKKVKLELTDELLTQGTKVTALFKPSSLWFAGGKFGVSFNVNQMKVEIMEKETEYEFISDSDDDSEDEGEDTTTTTAADKDESSEESETDEDSD